jgi:hypothetical protein
MGPPKREKRSTHSMGRSLSHSELGLNWGGDHGRALAHPAIQAGVALLEAPRCMRPAMVFTIKSDALGPFPKAHNPSFFTAALVRSLS